MAVATPLQDQLLRDVPTVDGYKVLEPAVLVDKLPEGGMAAVYRGLHLDLKVDVAVKVLKPGQGQSYSPQAVARFRQEAEQAARLNDPNLVRIYDFPASKIGLLYLVMEYIDGETLEGRVQRKGRLTPHEAITIAYHCCNGLRAAHAEKVIHRDVKPPNILLSKRGHVKLTDLGIAKAQDSAAMGMTQEIALLGTPQYMAPELWRGAKFASQASDTWALGATLGFMVTGRHLIDGADTQEIMHKTLTEGFPNVGKIVPGLPPQLINVITACTEPNPRDRVTTDELVGMLRNLIDLLHGEYNLADPRAGGTPTTQVSTRIPSRTDLDEIRKHLEKIKVPTPLPGTLPPRERPGTLVKNRTRSNERVSILGDGPVLTTARPAPPRARPPQGRPPKKKAKSGGGIGLYLTIFIVAFAGVATYNGVKNGWLELLKQWLNNSGKPSVPTTNPEGSDAQSNASTHPATRQVAMGSTKPTPSSVEPKSVPGTGETKVVAGPVQPPIGPVANVGGTTKPPDAGDRPKPPGTSPANPPGNTPVSPPAVVGPLAATADYQKLKRQASELANNGNWAGYFSQIAAWRGLADGASKRDEFVADVDSGLMRFRTTARDLSQRRTAFPDLLKQLAPAVDAGSGVAALVSAEQQMIVTESTGVTRVSAADRKVGLADAARLLNLVREGKHEDAKRDAGRVLIFTRIGQLDWLATTGNWKGMFDAMRELPVADPMFQAYLPRVQADTEQLLIAFRAANTGSAKVHAAVGTDLDLDQILTPYINAGSGTAALIDADWLLKTASDGSLIGIRDGAAKRAVEVLLKAQANPIASISTQASKALVTAYAPMVREAANQKDWSAVFRLLSQSKQVALSPNATPDDLTNWRNGAEDAIARFRKANADLDTRRETYPTLASEIQPLANDGVFAARLVLAEDTIGYEGTPPLAVPRKDDTEFKIARARLSPCIADVRCPRDIQDDAANRQWDIFAWFVRESVKARQPALVAKNIEALSKCGGSPARDKAFDALLDEVLPADDPMRTTMRVKQAEEQLKLGEVEGERAILQRDAPTLENIRQRLDSVRQSTNGPAKARACALLGEMARLDPSVKGQAQAFRFYLESLTAKSEGGRRDPIALLGLARFYRLEDAALDTLVPEVADVERIKKFPVADRNVEAWKLYQEAATTKDPYALYAAGAFAYKLFGNDGRDYLGDAAKANHAGAKKLLAQKRASGR